MKQLILAILLLVVGHNMNAQKSVNRLIDELKKDKNAYALTLPGWLLRTGIKIADEGELKYEKGFQELVNGIKRLRVLYINKKPNIDRAKLNDLAAQIIAKDEYEDYANIRDQGSNVRVIVKEDNTRIRSIVLLASGEDEFTILNLKTDLDLEDLKNADLSFNKNRSSK